MGGRLRTDACQHQPANSATPMPMPTDAKPITGSAGGSRHYPVLVTRVPGSR
jgi:hypothetical protein